MQANEYMQHGWDMMPYGMIIGPIMMFIMIVAIVFIIRCIGGGSCNMSNHHRSNQPKDAMDILKERFAKGEIDKKEFEDKKKIILE